VVRCAKVKAIVETSWVTGASSGLGRAMALRLAKQGHSVIASGRNHAALVDLVAEFKRTDEANKNGTIQIVAFDLVALGGNEAERDGAIQKIRGYTDVLDRVYINAGTCEYFDIESPDWSMAARVEAINYLGAITTVELALPFLQRSSNGHIIGIGSQAALAPFARAQFYGASKAALHYFLDSLRIDVKRFNIDVSLILPGFIETPLTAKNPFPMPFICTADDAAKRILVATQKRQPRYVFPKRLALLLWFARQMPRLWLAIQQPKKAHSSHEPEV